MILCVDPDDAAREATATALGDAGFEARTAGSLAAAEEAVAADGTVDCVVTEYDLPDGTGLDLLETVRERAPDAACVVFTGRPVERVDTAAFGDLVAEYLSKNEPEARDRLAELVGQSLAFRNQTAYPLPDDEEARVAALDRYATDPEALGDSLDRLTELATALFDAEAAAVGLVGAHEERFIACRGIAIDRVPREDTVCTYAILDDQVTVVEDVREDPRFQDNDRLTDVGIRFYASAPLVTSAGRTIGTFCVYDAFPRRFEARDRELLGLLAEEAMDQLELRRRLTTTEGSDDE
jgi:GAF domain-containing protein